MHAVARVKWNAQTPIHDPERERALLENVVNRGRVHGLDADAVRPFFAAQMDAAKLIQEDDFRRWQAEEHSPFADVPDLSTLRQQIDALNVDLLKALAEASPFLNTAAGQTYLNSRATNLFGDLSAGIRETALRPLRRP